MCLPRPFLVAAGLASAILPLSACSDWADAPASRAASAHSTASSHPTLVTPGASAPATERTTSSSPPTGFPRPQARATGRQTKVTFDLPQNFALFDRDALQDRARLEQMSRITGAPADALRVRDPAIDLQALALHKEHGGTTNILLMTSNGPAVPSAAAARSSVAEAGAEWTGYRLAEASTGPVAVIASHEKVGPGQELFYADVFTRGGGRRNVHLTVTAATRTAADTTAARIVSSIRAVR